MALIDVSFEGFDQTGRHCLRITKVGVFGRSSIPVEKLSPDDPVFKVLSGLLASTDVDVDGRALVETNSTTGEISIHPSVLAGLTAAEAEALRAPPPLPLALDLRSDGMVFDPRFRVVPRFVGGGGTAARAEVRGALAQYDGRVFRLPQPLFGLYLAAQSLIFPIENEPQRLEAIARLKSALPSDFGFDLSDGYLRDLRILYAASTSLALKPRGDSIDIDPVLFGRAAGEVSSEGEVLDEAEFALLTPREQKIFSEGSFVRSAEARPAYSLGGNTYVYVDPALRPVLSLLRRMQQADPAVRREFALDPRRLIREECSIDDDALLNSLFIETEQFSNRVTGLDVWRKPVLPWITPRPNSWLPEKLGLRVGDETIAIDQTTAPTLVAELEKAIAEDRPSVCLDGVDVPATQQSLECVRAIVRVSEAAAYERSRSPDDAVGEPPADLKIFLTVKDNLECVSLVVSPGTADAVIVPAERPHCLKTDLKPHQQQGFEWLSELMERRIPGALLADDMGLGKTLQGLVALARRRELGVSGRLDRKPSLIVAPTGLLANWQAEIDRHLGKDAFGSVECAYGSQLKRLREGRRSRPDTATGRSGLDVSLWMQAGLVLTTYETLRDYHLSFARVPFAIVIFDEAQKVKNPASQVTRAVKTLNAELKLAMTGTPVENRLQDVWSIVDVVWAGRLGSSQQFAKDYPETSVERVRRLHQALTQREEHIPPFMLRRLKKDQLAGLPSKTVRPVRMPMPAEQAAAYYDIVARAMAVDGPRSPGDMLAILHALRQASLHPERPERASGDLIAWARKSARLTATLDILDEVRKTGEKALIFLEDLDMQSVVATLITSRYGLKRRPDIINGETPGAARQKIVERFQGQGAGFDVLILSPKAGGVGLTITAANHVIHLTRWWNPAVEDQATDRVYRIGQDRPVTVHLPLAVHPDLALTEASFDLRLDALLSRKRQLSEDLLLPVEEGDEDLTGLFGAILKPNTEQEAPLAGEVTSRPPEPASQGQPVDRPLRPTLSLKQRPVTGTTEPIASEAVSPQHWTLTPGQSRNYAEYFAVFRGRRIGNIEIVDPYCMKPDCRLALAIFLSEIEQVVDSIDAVHITAWSPESRSARDETSETEAAALRDFKQKLAQRVKRQPRFEFEFVNRRRDYGSDFHDRFLYFDLVGANGTETWYMNLTGGIERLINVGRQCDVILKPVAQRLH